MEGGEDDAGRGGGEGEEERGVEDDAADDWAEEIGPTRGANARGNWVDKRQTRLDVRKSIESTTGAVTRASASAEATSCIGNVGNRGNGD